MLFAVHRVKKERDLILNKYVVVVVVLSVGHISIVVMVVLYVVVVVSKGLVYGRGSEI